MDWSEATAPKGRRSREAATESTQRLRFTNDSPDARSCLSAAMVGDAPPAWSEARAQRGGAAGWEAVHLAAWGAEPLKWWEAGGRAWRRRAERSGVRGGAWRGTSHPPPRCPSVSLAVGSPRSAGFAAWRDSCPLWHITARNPVAPMKEERRTEGTRRARWITSVM